MPMTMKLHLNFLTENSFGGLTTGTLCGRENAKSDDGTNSTSVQAEVTCGHCLKILAAGHSNWRYRKYVEKEAA